MSTNCAKLLFRKFSFTYRSIYKVLVQHCNYDKAFNMIMCYEYICEKIRECKRSSVPFVTCIVLLSVSLSY